MRGLYIHIPFCKSICTYCDFPKMVSGEGNKTKYMNALFRELDEKQAQIEGTDTVYIGGGTPNMLSDTVLESLLEKIRPQLLHSVESTIECNPELVSAHQAELFSRYGINRVSLGVQTISDERLRILGRHHNREIVLQAISILRNAGIQNISMDFIFGTPGETMEELDMDLDFVREAGIPHVSFYSLIMEEKTILSHKLDQGEITLPDDDLVADMYDHINCRLQEMGYVHYEVSNYAREGFESVHNELYWKCEEYAGVGLGAAGYVKPYRYTNKHTLKEYSEHVGPDTEYIGPEEEKKEFLMLGLRMLKGISVSEYQNRFHSDPFSDFPLQHHLSTGLLKIQEGRLFIPEEHMFIANLVFEEFV